MSATDQTIIDAAVDAMLDAVDGITLPDLERASRRLYAVASAMPKTDREETVARLLHELSAAELAVHQREVAND